MGEKWLNLITDRQPRALPLLGSPPPHPFLTPSKFRQKLIEGEARRSGVCVYADELSLRLCSDNYCIPPVWVNGN